MILEEPEAKMHHQLPFMATMGCKKEKRYTQFLSSHRTHPVSRNQSKHIQYSVIGSDARICPVFDRMGDYEGIVSLMARLTQLKWSSHTQQ